MAIKFIDVKYKDIFQNLNFEINDNEIISVVGKNGTGKTSLLNLIWGGDLKFSGEIIVGRKSISNKTTYKNLKNLRSDIYYLQQDYQNQLFNINILEDIKSIVSNLNMDKLNELLEYFNLDNKILKKSYYELSNGELKKILIIMMFIKNSKVILLDNPDNDLDQKSISTLIKLLKKAKRDGKLIIITSQNSEFLLEISDEILVLHNGKILKQDSKYEFFSNQELLNKCGLIMPNVLQFRENVRIEKKIKLVYRDNINDLIKDIYRNAK